MPPRSRQFAGFERPFLHSLRDLLLASGVTGGHGDAPDLSGTVVVLPGARAGRRLLELLVERCREMGRGLVPPRILTVGGLVAEALRPAPGANEAGAIERRLAWAMALRAQGTPEGGRQKERASLVPWLRRSELIERAHRELAGEGLRFADVMRRAPWATAGAGFDDGDRWSGLSALQDEYRRRLSAAGLEDPNLSRLGAIQDPQRPLASLGAFERVVLAGVTELSGLARRVVDAIGDRCTALVFAPESMASRFDEYGCVVPEAWEGEIELSSAQVAIVDSPADQAAAALGALGSLPHEVAPDNITIGVPDDEVTGHIERLAGRLGGIAVHRAAGYPGGVAASAPFRLLAAAAEFLERRRMRDFTTLVRHPDVERWLVRRLARRQGGRLGRTERWLRRLDEYQAEHLAVRVPKWRADAEDERPLAWLAKKVDKLLEGLARSAGEQQERPLSDWAEPIWTLLYHLYGGAPRATAARLARDACAVMREALARMRALHPSLGGLTLSAAEAIRVLLSLVAREPLVDEGGGEPAIELLGWLELPHDDAEVLILTGINEGCVPQPVGGGGGGGSEALLPGSVRSQLGLPDQRRRYARDAHALTAMAATRPGLTIIAGRRTLRHEPLAPSRLLLACRADELLHRVRLWVGKKGEAQAVPRLRIPHRGASRFLAPAPVGALPGPITSMSVTSFKDYLASPYYFYLKHVLRLQEKDAGGPELDPLGFGNLLHDVLKLLQQTDVARSDDPDRVAAFLWSHLESIAVILFGEEPLPAVQIQLEQAKARLRAFARRQAAWAAEGWRLAHAEWAAPGESGAPWVVAGAPIGLRGRIDRIDYNEKLKAWAILDYKTGDTAPTPKQHRRRDGTWKDLQLPLYRHVAAPLSLKGEIRLGLIVIRSKPDEVKFDLAEWGPDELRSADDAAREVVQGVRAGRFEDVGEWPPRSGTFAAMCGEGLIVADVEEGAR